MKEKLYKIHEDWNKKNIENIPIYLIPLFEQLDLEKQKNAIKTISISNNYTSFQLISNELIEIEKQIRLIYFKELRKEKIKKLLNNKTMRKFDKIYFKEYYEKNKDKLKSDMKIYQEKNKDKLKEYRKAYYKEYLKNLDKEVQKVKYMKYYLDNRIEAIEYQKAYYEKNKEKIKEYQKAYYENNRNKAIEYQKELYKKKTKNKQIIK